MVYYFMTLEQLITFQKIDVKDAHARAHARLNDFFGRDIFQSVNWSIVTKRIVKEEYETANQPIINYLNELKNDGAVARQKTKVLILTEAAEFFKNQGIKAGYVVNVTLMESRYYEIYQSWFVYQDGSTWYFKMRTSCKTAHVITGVTA